MSGTRKDDLHSRLDAYFETLRSSSLTEVVKRSVANWQVYAAVSSSAVAMATSASAAALSAASHNVTPEPTMSARIAKPFWASSKNPPFVNAVRMAMARRDVAPGFLNANAAVVNAAASAAGPTIARNGVVPLDGTASIIQPGEWVSIFGTNLASAATTWNGDFPTMLGGTSVQINGKKAYLMFVSPNQINLQAPDDSTRGPVMVAVTTAAGTATAVVTLNDVAPSFDLLDNKHVAGVILRP